MSRSRGATPGVNRFFTGNAFTADGLLEVRGASHEVAFCSCGERLTFGTDGAGQVWEACSDATCGNSIPHQPVLDVSILKGPDLAQQRTATKRAKRLAAQQETEEDDDL